MDAILRRCTVAAAIFILLQPLTVAAESLGSLIRTGSSAEIKEVLDSGVDVNKTLGALNYTPLMIASKKREPDIVNMLLKAGADPNVTNDGGWSSLLLASRFREDPAVLEVLLNGGADVTQTNDQGKTAFGLLEDNKTLKAKIKGTYLYQELKDGLPLYELAHSENRSKIIGLLKKGRQIHKRSKSGRTPLMTAAQYNNPSVVEVLITHDANVNARNIKGQTALMFAILGNAPVKTVRLLVKGGASITAKDSEGQTALMYAAYVNVRPEVVEQLLKVGANPNAQDNSLRTPLMYAAMGIDSFLSNISTSLEWRYLVLKRNYSVQDSRTIMQLLGKHDAQLNAQDKNGWTALMYAAATNKKAIIQNLLIQGADASIKNNEGKAAFDIAKRQNENIKGSELYWRLNDLKYR